MVEDGPKGQWPGNIFSRRKLIAALIMGFAIIPGLHPGLLIFPLRGFCPSEL